MVSSIGTGTPGHRDGGAPEANFKGPLWVEYVEEDQSLLVADSGNRVIRKINFEGNECTYVFHK